MGRRGGVPREREREKTERDGVGSASSTSSGSFGMCSHKLYARSGVASAAASNGGTGGGGGAEVHAMEDCLLLLPSGSADHSNQIAAISVMPAR